MNASFRHRTGRHSRRQGATIIVLLMLISVTLALSYAIMRSQATVTQVQSNFDRRNLARQAAMAGMTIALRKMSASDWAGVDTPLSGTLTTTESYSVTYTTGDAELTSTNPLYSEYPFRVTVKSTGISQDRANPTLNSTYVVQSVMKLVPRNLGTRETTWSQMMSFTAYQKDAIDDFRMNMPARIEGAVRVQGEITTGNDYTWSSSAKQRFLSDLNQMRSNGYQDYRPFNGTISLPLGNTSSSDRALLSSNLGLTLVSISETPRAPLVFPSSLQSYRLYPGGKSYSVTPTSTTVQNTSLVADPITNPLGIFFNSSTITLKSNVTIRGTVISGNDVYVDGTNVVFQPFDLPSLSTSTGPVRLPAAVAGSDFEVDDAGTGSLTGIVLARNYFQIGRGHQNQAFTVTGRVVADGFRIYERSDWDYSSFVWNWLYSLFNSQLSNPPSERINYFPVYLWNSGMSPVPLLTIKPPDPSIPLNFHWQDPAQPFYIAHPSDGGLRWDLVRWAENP